MRGRAAFATECGFVVLREWAFATEGGDELGVFSPTACTTCRTPRQTSRHPKQEGFWKPLLTQTTSKCTLLHSTARKRQAAESKAMQSLEMSSTPLRSASSGLR